eukprot:COSAG06_NODE_6108_length_3106_cov_3.845693_2_plen_90_part_00
MDMNPDGEDDDPSANPIYADDALAAAEEGKGKGKEKKPKKGEEVPLSDLPTPEEAAAGGKGGKGGKKGKKEKKGKKDKKGKGATVCCMA